MKKPRHNEGSIMVFVAILALSVAVLGYGLVMSRQMMRENSDKELAKSLSTHSMVVVERSSIRDFVFDQLLANALVEPSACRSGTVGGIAYATSGAASIFAVGASSNLASLLESDDPFYGAKADRATFIVSQTGCSGSSALGQRDATDRTVTLAFDVRQFPLSQFTFYSSADATIGTSGSIGRTYCDGNLAFAQGAVCVSDYPVTAAGAITFNGGAALEMKAPGDVYLGQSAATGLDTKRSILKGVLGDQSVRKTAIVRPISLSGLMSGADLGSSAKNALRFQYDVTISVSVTGTIGTVTASGASVSSTNQVQISDATGVYTGPLTSMANGHPVISVDVAKLHAIAGWTSYYVSCSSDADAVVIVRHGDKLKYPFSLATPHEIWVDSGFNIPLTNDPVYVVQPASLVTLKRVLAVSDLLTP